MNTNQENQNSWGGRREGAGRPKGSYSKPQIRNFYTDEQVMSFVDELKESAKTDNRIKLFLAEQIFGKARQNIGLDGGEDGSPVRYQDVDIDDEQFARIIRARAAELAGSEGGTPNTD